jgi:hypothetical protein
MTSLDELFCSVDDFCQIFEPTWQSQLLADGRKSRKRWSSLSLSEMMTIQIAFHQSSYRNFKTFYIEKVQAYWQPHFPGLFSYNRFVEKIPSSLLTLLFWPLHWHQLHGFYLCQGLSQPPY